IFCFYLGLQCLRSFPTRRSSDLYEFTTDIEGFAVYYTVDFYLHYARERHLDRTPFFHSIERPTFIRANTRTIKPVLSTLEEMLRSEEHTSELQSRENLVCRLLLE